jgi:peptidyl-tRNA hydrolase, PTH2 family
METKQVIVVRKDLKTAGFGKLMAQVAHASMSAAITDYLIDSGDLSWFYIPPKEIREWLRGSFTKICVWAKDEEELLDIYMKARQADLPCSLIKDNGRTVFKGVPTFTTVAVGPGEISEIDKITGHLPLI